MSSKVYVAGVGMGKFKKPGAHDPYEVMGGNIAQTVVHIFENDYLSGDVITVSGGL